MAEFYPPSFSDDNSPNQVTYHGNCHCGAVRFKLTVESLHDRYLIRCNCAICSKHGLVTTQCKRKCLIITRGWDNMSAYRNSTGMGGRPMRFCATCACVIVFDIEDPEAAGASEEIVGVNMNTIADLDLETLVVRPFDGTALGKPYTLDP